MQTDRVTLRVGAKILIPFIIVFGLYVQFHGHYGPGGGFQAGVINAAAIILYALVYGLENAQRVVPASFVAACAALGVLVFAGTGVVALLMGGAFLDYDVLARDPVRGQHWGVFAVEFGVLITVFGVMVSIFYAFAGRGRAEP
jgi:multicomponent Na+:H+ antiporter subunit B